MLLKLVNKWRPIFKSLFSLRRSNCSNRFDFDLTDLQEKISSQNDSIGGHDKIHSESLRQQSGGVSFDSGVDWKKVIL